MTPQDPPPSFQTPRGRSRRRASPLRLAALAAFALSAATAGFGAATRARSADAPGAVLASLPVPGEAARETPRIVDPVEDLLLPARWRWLAGPPRGAGAVITYGFPAAPPHYYPADHWARDGFAPFGPAERARVREALAAFAAVADVRFVETELRAAAMTFGYADLPEGTGYTFYPAGGGVDAPAGDVWIDAAQAEPGLPPGSFAYMLLLHEIGHALGLDHVDAPSLGGEGRLLTVMAYDRPPAGAAEPETPMALDVAALQRLYGPNPRWRTGDDAYGPAQGRGGTATIWDAGGADALDFSAATGPATIDLREGQVSRLDDADGATRLVVAYGAVIEDARGGAGDDVIVSNPADNALTGGGGADRFRFLAGWGDDVVTDFGAGDRIDLSGAGLSFRDLRISREPGGVLISAPGGTIRLLGVAAVTAADFLFGESA